jgi:hypothetical protein
METTRKMRVGVLLLLFFSSSISVFLGYLHVRRAPGGQTDFRLVYNGTRCLLQHSDPYNAGEFQRVYLGDGGDLPSTALQRREFPGYMRYVYLPTNNLIVAPFALLPWQVAHLLWTLIIAGSLSLAAFLMWDIGRGFAPDVSFYLVCFILGNSVVLFTGGNPAGMAVSFSVLAVWCFVKERFTLAGVLCLAVSLVIKPHLASLVWLFFLLAGGCYRKRALQTLAAVAVLGLPGVLWVSYVAPHWIQELHANLVDTAVRGGVSDPGPASYIGSTPGMIIDLQSAISVFRDDPRVYNLVSYLIFGVLAFVWLLKTLRSRIDASRVWLALAPIVCLSMLPFYHRLFDAKFLLLTVAACAMLWAKSGVTGRVALLVTSVGFLLTGEAPILSLRMFPVPNSGIFGKVLTVLLTRPVPIVLLVMGIFYLWVYVKSSADYVADRAHEGVNRHIRLE